MFLKKRNDDVTQVLEPADAIRHAFLVVRSHYSALEETLQCKEEPDVPPMLHDGEFRKHLKPGLHLWVWIDADVETTFAVNKANHPIGIEPVRSRLNVKSLRVLHV